jgi:SAM-dependent methyltransferase
VLQELARLAPARVLEVGCGTGALAARIQADIACQLIAVDQSPAMVEAARAAGVAAVVGDVERLDFGDAAFDCAIAAWMLYHVADVDQALSELARVLVPGGWLIAVTNCARALAEVYDSAGASRPHSPFSSENGERLLRRHFAAVRRMDFRPRAVFADRAALAGYLATLGRGELADRIGDVRWPLVAHGAVTVFGAQRSAWPGHLPGTVPA